MSTTSSEKMRESVRQIKKLLRVSASPLYTDSTFQNTNTPTFVCIPGVCQNTSSKRPSLETPLTSSESAPELDR